MNVELLNEKIEISEIAVSLWEQNGGFSISEIAEATNKTASQIYSLFPNKNAILEFYYPSLIIKYSAMIEEIEGFNSYSISERISNFIFTSFDMMSEHPEFTGKTFEKMVFDKGSDSEFYTETVSVLTNFFTTDGNIAVSAGFLMKDYFYEFIAKEYLHVLKFWLKDDSESKERSFALTDKLTGFLEELIYNKTIDKGFDLAKYLVSHAGLAKNIPFIGDWITELFTEKENEQDE